MHFSAAAPDALRMIEEMVEEADKVVTRLTGYGAQTGE
jgi:hypothetical protein